jgi:hypothetical protein
MLYLGWSIDVLREMLQSQGLCLQMPLDSMAGSGGGGGMAHNRILGLWHLYRPPKGILGLQYR